VSPEIFVSLLCLLMKLVVPFDCFHFLAQTLQKQLTKLIHINTTGHNELLSDGEKVLCCSTLDSYFMNTSNTATCSVFSDSSELGKIHFKRKLPAVTTMNKNAPSESLNTIPEIIITLGRNDILLGRGAFCINHVGNVQFRNFCGKYRERYNKTTSRKIKSSLAKELLSILKSEGYRFLRQLTDIELSQFGVSSTSRCWVVADAASTEEKVKQSLRDKGYNCKSKETDAGTAIVKDVKPRARGNYDVDQSFSTFSTTIPVTTTTTTPPSHCSDRTVPLLYSQFHSSVMPDTLAESMQPRPFMPFTELVTIPETNLQSVNMRERLQLIQGQQSPIERIDISSAEQCLEFASRATGSFIVGEIQNEEQAQNKNIGSRTVQGSSIVGSREDRYGEQNEIHQYQNKLSRNDATLSSGSQSWQRLRAAAILNRPTVNVVQYKRNQNAFESQVTMPLVLGSGEGASREDTSDTSTLGPSEQHQILLTPPPASIPCLMQNYGNSKPRPNTTNIQQLVNYRNSPDQSPLMESQIDVDTQLSSGSKNSMTTIETGNLKDHDYDAIDENGGTKPDW
jgi:hypothetical protein